MQAKCLTSWLYLGTRSTTLAAGSRCIVDHGLDACVQQMQLCPGPAILHTQSISICSIKMIEVCMRFECARQYSSTGLMPQQKL